MQNNRTQIILASQQFLLRLGIKTLLNIVDIDSDIIEVASMDEFKRTYESVDSSCYTIISTDLNSSDNPSFVHMLNTMFPSCQFLLISGVGTIEETKDICVVSQECSQTEIIQKVQNFLIPPPETKEEKLHTILSEREVDVLKAIAVGLSNKQTAEKLYISTNTVVSHRKNITEKLGIKTIAGLTVYALMHELIQAEEVTS